MKKQQLIKEIKEQQTKSRSKWQKGVFDYALELAEELNEETPTNFEELKSELLNGASDWGQYSWGGCSLIYNADICERLATPSEQKRTNNGDRRPNANEEWLDTQARALYQAFYKIWGIVKGA